MNKPTPVRNHDVMCQDYAMVDGLQTVAEAIEQAVSHKVNVLFVNKRYDDDEYGMVLMSDIAKKVLAKDKAPERVNIYEIMVKPVLAVNGNMDVRYCARLFDRFGITKAPVVEQGKIVGLVSYHDIVLKGMINRG
ncbi:CBS domain-containing protein [Shewanella sp. Choline-02u-19]|jgi:predicted transcriptional regulator|uniref:CBS domain-containing protein n=1 Tax=unclassified Shewanella TaxID=196818 RepID=UPI000C327610|nr:MULTISPECIES: CBS domain-containing protein [unclassified Shewanella]PKG58399.1 CBS domain-containing protein [Shewanella sp. GutDb-MelDb]PKG73329.1 CBS domain-containing protein [Shewanella sp. GutCb]PKH59203.1 CBS domain-containing protein [Shewanella sp. Bg11-22]PKI27078.1 CBS domain-containing protein [Shewanella sp. Choline-02u-19]